MVRLEGRQWGLVVVVAGTPFFLAILLAAASPGLVEPVLGTLVGGASWLLAALLGLLGGALFAAGLGGLTPSLGPTTSPARRALGLTLTALVPVGLCIIPAICLLLVGPALALRLEHGEAMPPTRERFRTPQELAQRLRQQLPRTLPSLPQVNPW
ncbi:hypothetical protein [Vitiosangium sp. GDMCC 1.1324]|uniref:hypothetical protein n=1 Tax=Vitiosangium sp. (strain GDMCC 1.1324) TaxID=2138576 RepID=UPI000D3A9E2D|nr:hypothetical protein [Vitiosangium sp. GDMCC 1.1324]PTL85431.1 hypothetical protein DAT35_01550 [Vitiosangium sp. GDMCC 1.1324]